MCDIFLEAYVVILVIQIILWAMFLYKTYVYLWTEQNIYLADKYIFIVKYIVILKFSIFSTLFPFHFILFAIIYVCALLYWFQLIFVLFSFVNINCLLLYTHERLHVATIRKSKWICYDDLFPVKYVTNT